MYIKYGIFLPCVCDSLVIACKYNLLCILYDESHIDDIFSGKSSIGCFWSGSFWSNNRLQLKIKIMNCTPCLQSHLNFLVKERKCFFGKRKKWG